MTRTDEDGETGVYVVDVERGGSPRRLTTEGSGDLPVWSADGEWVIFASAREGDVDLYRKMADQSGAAERILERPGIQQPLDVHGSRLLFRDAGLGGAADLYIVDLEKPGEVEPVAASAASESDGRFSPDGRYVAITSNESGSREVYVIDLETGSREIASSGGGANAVWSPDGTKLYTQFGLTLSEVSVQLEPELRLGVPRPLFSGRRPFTDLSPDGTHFVRTIAASNARDDPEVDPQAFQRIDVVINWFSKLEELAPTGR